jgi:hypothetical protein
MTQAAKYVVTVTLAKSREKRVNSVKPEIRFP